MFFLLIGRTASRKTRALHLRFQWDYQNSKNFSMNFFFISIREHRIDSNRDFFDHCFCPCFPLYIDICMHFYICNVYTELHILQKSFVIGVKYFQLELFHSLLLPRFPLDLFEICKLHLLQFNFWNEFVHRIYTCM